ncbi:MAG: 3-methyl-2-oxobutanoate hydroxymethyltransferase [Candidatus Promineifilaceae bacterium]|jgi:3-methyl-2-oxobutanoate hydroxymethyltransferase
MLVSLGNSPKGVTMRKRLTIHDLKQAKGKRQLTEIFTDDGNEARACDAAGIDMIVTGAHAVRRIRGAAPNVFVTAAIAVNDPNVTTESEALRAAFEVMAAGADAVYVGLSPALIRGMTREGVAVIGHVGYVPYRAGWYGGPRAVGKTAPEALKVYRDTMAFEDAGAIAVEMEIVPEKVATEISKRTAMSVISMGSGSGCDAQYLFAEDVLGTNTNHVPRHAKVYGNLSAELERVQALRVEAMKAFQKDVSTGGYPEAKHNLKVNEEEFTAFLNAIA